MQAPNVHSGTRESAERQIQYRWYDLVMAEQAGQPQQALEMLYHRYLRAVEEYIRLCQQKGQRLAS